MILSSRQAVSDNFKRNVIKKILLFLILLAVADFIYKTVNKIDYINRAKCIFSQVLNNTGFLILENFIELPIIVFLGIFAAVLIEKYFLRFKKFFPSNVITAFIYGSIIPVCSCSIIPVIKTMQDKMKFRILITFLITAPLLNPYIIVLSFTVIGIKYGLLRIAASFILAVSAGFILEFFYNKCPVMTGNIAACNTNDCMVNESDIFLKTYYIFKSILLYIVIAGIFSIGLDILLPKSAYFASMNKSILGNLIVIILGVPLYLCNGTDILLIRPAICSGLPLGTAIAFSLSSTAICITSIFMLFKFIGRKLTFILVGYIMLITFVMSIIINMVFGNK